MELKKLASQTAIYGLSSMVGRFLNFLLVPLYTLQFLPEEYGVVTVLYAYVGFFAVLLSYGMETAFFNFTRKDIPTEKVYATGFYALLTTTLVFTGIALLLAQPIAIGIGYPNHPEYIRYFVLVLACDTISVLPFALLRKQNKALKFAAVKMLWIAVNVGLNLYFVYYGYQKFAAGETILLFDPTIGVGYIFMANLIASVFTLFFLLPEFKFAQSKPDLTLLKQMLIYAWPLILVGFAGMINELLDRIILKYLLPADTADFDIGIYGAFYKISIAVTLFVQAFRFAGEPFFFEKSKDQNAPATYAKVMNYFVAICGLVFLTTMLFIHQIAPLIIRQKAYFTHEYALTIVPILLMANVCLGIYYNLSIWYKLSEKTLLGSTVAIGGAVVTIVLNIMLVPTIGILGSAITTLVAYGGMALAAYIMGQKHFPVPYQISHIFTYLAAALLFWYGHDYFLSQSASWLQIVTSLILIGLYTFMVFAMERKQSRQ